jgi:hypothetical protein
MTSTNESRPKATIFQVFRSKRVNPRLTTIMPKCEFDLDSSCYSTYDSPT